MTKQKKADVAFPGHSVHDLRNRLRMIERTLEEPQQQQGGECWSPFWCGYLGALFNAMKLHDEEAAAPRAAARARSKAARS